ncbi:unnamed protein product, partial [Brachionus calyciflorus]
MLLIYLILLNFMSIGTKGNSGEYPNCIFLGCSCIKDTIRCPYDNSEDSFLTMFPKRRIGKTYSNSMTIDISSNGLEMVPDDRFAGLNVKKIDLSKNLIYKLSADTFRDIKTLKILDLSSNKLKYLNSNTFIPIESTLETLILNNNYLNEMETIRLVNVILKLNNLKNLEITKNRLIYVPNLIKSNLTKLSLGFNLFESLLDSDTYENLLPSSLVELNLENNRLKQINDNSFENLFNLKYLNLESNEISAIAENSFKNLRNLLVLNLKRNSIKHIPSRIFYTLDNLERLDLSSQSQQLKFIGDYAFDRHSNRKPIKLILLNNNSISRIENRAFCSKFNKKPYINVKEIDLSQNLLTKITSCIFRQLNKGFSDPSIGNTRQKIQSKIVLNKKGSNSSLIECGCEITRSNKLIDLDGICRRSDGSSVYLNQYDCGDYSIHSSGAIHKYCQAQTQYECLVFNEDSTTTKTYSTETNLNLIFKTFPYNMSHNENATYGDQTAHDGEVNEGESCDQDTDEEPDSDNGNKENIENIVTASRSGELVQLLEQFVASEDRIRCE